MEREMSLLDEMAMAAGVESLIRRRRRKTLFGMDRRLALLTLVLAGVAITMVISWYQENTSRGRQHSAEYPKLVA